MMIPAGCLHAGAVVVIYDLRGHIIASSHQSHQSHQAVNNGLIKENETIYLWQPNNQLTSLTSGIYLVKIKQGGQEITKRIVYLK